jgi:hypothetical protein
MDGKGFGLLIVIGSEPEIGVRSARGGNCFFPGRRIANELIEASKDESKMDDNDGVWPLIENQSLLLSSELGKRSSL